MSEIPHPDDPTRESSANTIGDPVTVRGVSQTSAGSYGAGLAPFFLGLATWIGAFVLFLLLRPLSRRALAGGHAAADGVGRVALGGWLPAALLGAAQVVVMYAVDGLRHLMYGGPPTGAWRDALVLAGYLVVGLALATLAAYKQRVWTPSRLKPELVL